MTKWRAKSLWTAEDYKHVMPYYVDFVIPGFERSYPKGLFKCPAFTERESREWFLSFVKHVEDSMGRRYLPIYRMGDGEFQVCVGYRYRYRKDGEEGFRYVVMLMRAAAGRLRKRLSGAGWAAKTAPWAVSGDHFSSRELGEVREKLREEIRFVAEKGYLALKFSCRKDSMFTQHYIGPMFSWLKESGIRLDDENYVDVYFVYAMLTGPCRKRLFDGRRVLVITSFDDAKGLAILKGLRSEGAAEVQFVRLPQGRSMYDRIDLSNLKRPIDLVLVGRGIGAAGILCQLEPLNTVAIDAGYIIECLADPERRKLRTFCWPDGERKGDYGAI